MSKIPLLLLFLTYTQIVSLKGQEYRIPLYAGEIPNSRPSKISERLVKGEYTWLYDVTNPDIAVYLPQAKYVTGQAVVICPGGGYRFLSYDNYIEGTDVARFFNSLGIAAIVLKYRLPSAETCIEPHKAPLMDAQRALRMVRVNAAKWNINPEKIGIMGFSAGGHLAATAGTHFDEGNKSDADSVERESCRPNFMILLYPVISLVDTSLITNTRKKLLGENPAIDLMCYYSCEQQVKENTPPAFIAHAENDKIVSVEHSLLIYEALRKKNISSELHILTEGGHGFGLVTNNKHVVSWKESLELWLESLQNVNLSK
jgi:acetyl esterase/lipase